MAACQGLEGEVWIQTVGSKLFHVEIFIQKVQIELVALFPLARDDRLDPSVKWIIRIRGSSRDGVRVECVLGC